MGSWEYQNPGTNEYVEYQFLNLYNDGVVSGKFRKYTRDQNGQIDRTIFDSSSPTESVTISYAAFSGIRNDTDDLGTVNLVFIGGSWHYQQ